MRIRTKKYDVNYSGGVLSVVRLADGVELGGVAVPVPEVADAIAAIMQADDHAAEDAPQVTTTTKRTRKTTKKTDGGGE